MLMTPIYRDGTMLPKPQENNNNIINPVSNAQNAYKEVLCGLSNLFI